MTVTRLWTDGKSFTITGSGYNPVGDFLLDNEKVDLQAYPAARTALWVGTLNNDAQLEPTGESEGKITYRMVGDPTEGSILVAAHKAGASARQLNEAFPRLQEIPFDSERKRMVTINELRSPSNEDISPLSSPTRTNACHRGKRRPDVVLKLCSYKIASTTRTNLSRGSLRNSGSQRRHDPRRLRVLVWPTGLCPKCRRYQPEALEKDLVFIGLIGMIDPPATKSNQRSQKQNCWNPTVMLPATIPTPPKPLPNKSFAPTRDRVMTGAELDVISPEDMREAVKVTDVYARVSPEHKMKIVDALRDNHEVCNEGRRRQRRAGYQNGRYRIAMGITGTDVAKETATWC
jgi:Ca2+-transporting ATPase